MYLSCYQLPLFKLIVLYIYIESKELNENIIYIYLYRNCGYHFIIIIIFFFFFLRKRKDDFCKDSFF